MKTFIAGVLVGIVGTLICLYCSLKTILIIVGVLAVLFIAGAIVYQKSKKWDWQ